MDAMIQTDIEDFLPPADGQASFVVSAGDFTKAVARAMRPIARSGIPILNCVLVTSESGTVTVTGTDMDTMISSSLAIRRGHDYRFAVDAAMLHAAIRHFAAEEPITFTQSKRAARVDLQCGSFRGSLKTEDAEDFPATTKSHLPFEFEIEGKELATLLDRPWMAMATDETRYLLCGVHFHRHGEILRAACCSNAAVAYYESALPDGAINLPPITIPRRAAGEMRKLIGDDMVKIGVSESRFWMQNGSVVFGTKMIDGGFPDYTAIIPKTNEIALRVEAKALSRAIDMVADFSKIGNFRVIRIKAANNQVEVSASEHDRGEACVEIAPPQASFTHEFEVGLNATGLREICTGAAGDLEILIKDGASAVVVNDLGDAAALFVLSSYKI